jgi:hypothetical protein
MVAAMLMLFSFEYYELLLFVVVVVVVLRFSQLETIAGAHSPPLQSSVCLKARACACVLQLN